MTTDAATQTPRLWHHRLIGAVFAVTMHTLRVVPGWLAYGAGKLLTPLVVAVAIFTRKADTRRRRGFYWNTEVVFRGSLNASRRRRLLWAWASHMARLGVDICRMPRLTASNYRDHCEVADLDRLRACFDEGRGLIIVSGHIGVFELTGHLISLAGISLTTVFRESPIPPITDVLNRCRNSGGQSLLEKDGAVRPIMRLLAAKKAVGIMADVSSKESEIFAPFLGTAAATNNTAGILHLKTGAPIVVATTSRVGSRYRFHLWDLIDHQRSDDRDADLKSIATRINEGLCAGIYHSPAEWFWDSRRFRTRPKDEVPDDRDMPPQLCDDQLARFGDRI